MVFCSCGSRGDGTGLRPRGNGDGLRGKGSTVYHTIDIINNTLLGSNSVRNCVECQKYRQKVMNEIKLERLKILREQEKIISRNRCEKYQEMKDKQKFVREEEGKKRKYDEKIYEYEKNCSKYASMLVTTGTSHRFADEYLLTTQLNEKANLKTKHDLQVKQHEREQVALSHRQSEISSLHQPYKDAQKRRHLKSEQANLDRESAALVHENHIALQKLRDLQTRNVKLEKEKMKHEVVQFQTTQSAESIEQRGRRPIQAKVIRHGLNAHYDNSIVENNCMEEKEKRTFQLKKQLNQELQSNINVKQRFHHAQRLAREQKDLLMIHDEFQILEKIDRSGNRIHRLNNHDKVLQYRQQEDSALLQSRAAKTKLRSPTRFSNEKHGTQNYNDEKERYFAKVFEKSFLHRTNPSKEQIQNSSIDQKSQGLLNWNDTSLPLEVSKELTGSPKAVQTSFSPSWNSSPPDRGHDAPDLSVSEEYSYDHLPASEALQSEIKTTLPDHNDYISSLYKDALQTARDVYESTFLHQQQTGRAESENSEPEYGEVEYLDDQLYISDTSLTDSYANIISDREDKVEEPKDDLAVVDFSTKYSLLSYKNPHFGVTTHPTKTDLQPDLASDTAASNQVFDNLSEVINEGDVAFEDEMEKDDHATGNQIIPIVDNDVVEDSQDDRMHDYSDDSLRVDPSRYVQYVPLEKAVIISQLESHESFRDANDAQDNVVYHPSRTLDSPEGNVDQKSISETQSISEGGGRFSDISDASAHEVPPSSTPPPLRLLISTTPLSGEGERGPSTNSRRHFVQDFSFYSNISSHNNSFTKSFSDLSTVVARHDTEQPLLSLKNSRNDLIDFELMFKPDVESSDSSVRVISLDRASPTDDIFTDVHIPTPRKSTALLPASGNVSDDHILDKSEFHRFRDKLKHRSHSQRARYQEESIESPTDEFSHISLSRNEEISLDELLTNDRISPIGNQSHSGLSTPYFPQSPRKEYQISPSISLQDIMYEVEHIDHIDHIAAPRQGSPASDADTRQSFSFTSNRSYPDFFNRHQPNISRDTPPRGSSGSYQGRKHLNISDSQSVLMTSSSDDDSLIFLRQSIPQSDGSLSSHSNQAQRSQIADESILSTYRLSTTSLNDSRLRSSSARSTASSESSLVFLGVGSALQIFGDKRELSVSTPTSEQNINASSLSDSLDFGSNISNLQDLIKVGQSFEEKYGLRQTTLTHDLERSNSPLHSIPEPESASTASSVSIPSFAIITQQFPELTHMNQYSPSHSAVSPTPQGDYSKHFPSSRDQLLIQSSISFNSNISSDQSPSHSVKGSPRQSSEFRSGSFLSQGIATVRASQGDSFSIRDSTEDFELWLEGTKIDHLMKERHSFLQDRKDRSSPLDIIDKDMRNIFPTSSVDSDSDLELMTSHHTRNFLLHEALSSRSSKTSITQTSHEKISLTSHRSISQQHLIDSISSTHTEGLTTDFLLGNE